jgi:PHD/YefM family antitoxin component YafN of YafNO toxin-antitoxin module
MTRETVLIETSAFLATSSMETDNWKSSQKNRTALREGFKSGLYD